MHVDGNYAQQGRGYVHVEDNGDFVITYKRLGGGVPLKTRVPLAVMTALVESAHARRDANPDAAEDRWNRENNGGQP